MSLLLALILQMIYTCAPKLKGQISLVIFQGSGCFFSSSYFYIYNNVWDPTIQLSISAGAPVFES